MEENIRLKELEHEIETLKTTIAPFSAFMQEIKDLKRNLHISSESSVSSFTIINTCIKSDILKDVNGMMSSTDDKIALVSQENKENYLHILEKITNCNRQDEHLEFMIKDTQDLIVKQGYIQDMLRKDLDLVKREVNDKVGYAEFIKLQKSLKHYAPLDAMNEVVSKIEQLAELSLVLGLKSELKKLVTRVEDCLTKQQAYDTFSSLEENLNRSFQRNFVSNEIFKEETNEFNKKYMKIDDDVKAVAKKLEMFHEGFKRKITTLFDTINNKPWDEDMKVIIHRVDETCRRDEVMKIKEELNEKCQKLGKELGEANKKALTFELIIERYDEILLDKASKDDVSLFQKILEGYVKNGYLEKVNSDIQAKHVELAQQVAQLSTISETLKTIMLSTAQKVEVIKKENFDVASLSSSLNSLLETIERKADKSDIFIIYDVMGKKDELTKVVEIEEVCRKQMLLIVGVLQTLCRTFIIAGENPGSIKKQRLDIYKTLEGLQRWIKEGTGDSTSFLSVGRSNVNLKSEYFDEGHATHYGTARFSRRIRQASSGASPRYFKDELPSLNL